MTNLTSFCSAAEQNAQSHVLKRLLILYCFYDKAVPPHVCSALWPKAFASSKQARWWRKAMGQRTTLESQESPNPSSQSKLKSNNCTKGCGVSAFTVEVEVGRAYLNYVFCFQGLMILGIASIGWFECKQFIRIDKTRWTDGSILYSAKSSKVKSLCVNEPSQLSPENYGDSLDSFSFFRGYWKLRQRRCHCRKYTQPSSPPKAPVAPQEALIWGSFPLLCCGDVWVQVYEHGAVSNINTKM